MAGILSKRPYLTKTDRATVKRMRDVGELTVFQLRKCRRGPCDEDVPPGKDFCSETCYKAEDSDDDGDEG